MLRVGYSLHCVFLGYGPSDYSIRFPPIRLVVEVDTVEVEVYFVFHNRS
jgi:hypothetical protein